MARFAGDFQGRCPSCDEDVEFALGVRTDRPAVAMHFGPGGPRSVELRDLELVLMTDDDVEMKFTFACPLCGQWTPGRTRCRLVPEPQSQSEGM